MGTQARRGSAIEALVAAAEPGGPVLTSDPGDPQALVAHPNGMAIETV